MVGLLERVTSPSQGHRTAQTQNKCIQTHTPNIHALSGIRTHGPSVRASEDTSCLRPRGCCDRRPYMLLYVIMYTTDISDNKNRIINMQECYRTLLWYHLNYFRFNCPEGLSKLGHISVSTRIFYLLYMKQDSVLAATAVVAISKSHFVQNSVFTV
jgi:hypothetical protein